MRASKMTTGQRATTLAIVSVLVLIPATVAEAAPPTLDGFPVPDSR